MTREALERRLPWVVDAGRRLPDPAYNFARRLARRSAVGFRVPFSWGSLRRTSPLNSHYGYGRGTPIDRWYIDRFMHEQSDAFRGRILEMQNPEWSNRYADLGTSSLDILDIDPTNTAATIVADLDESGSLPADRFDCIVVPQTLQYVRQPAVVLRTLGDAAARGCSILITVPTISKLDPTCGPDGDRWRFTPAGVKSLLAVAYPDAEHTISWYGNVLTATAFLQGVSAEELTAEELSYVDDDFPLLVCARVTL
jgi:hypothetical protein